MNGGVRVNQLELLAYRYTNEIVLGHSFRSACPQSKLRIISDTWKNPLISFIFLKIVPNQNVLWFKRTQPSQTLRLFLRFVDTSDGKFICLTWCFKKETSQLSIDKYNLREANKNYMSEYFNYEKVVLNAFSVLLWCRHSSLTTVKQNIFVF